MREVPRYALMYACVTAHRHPILHEPPERLHSFHLESFLSFLTVSSQLLIGDKKNVLGTVPNLLTETEEVIRQVEVG